MALKDELFRKFALHPLTAFSGEDLALRYHVSPAEICKAVSGLQSEGFDIIASQAGYTFTAGNDFLSAEAVSRIVPAIFFLPRNRSLTHLMPGRMPVTAYTASTADTAAAGVMRDMYSGCSGRMISEKYRPELLGD